MPEGVNRVDGRSERWRAHRVARRAEFVDAAFAALAEHGPGVGMAEIAAAAGVSKPRLYRHFADKAELFGAIVDRTSRLLWQRLEPALTEPAPIHQRVRQALEAYLGLVDEHPQVFRFIGSRRRHDLGEGADPVAEDKKVLAAVITTIFTDELRARHADSGGAEVWAHGIVGAVEAATEWWLERRTMSRESLTEYLTVLVWSAVDGALRTQGIVLDPDRPVVVSERTLRLLSEHE
ncbi:TetR/AcrR family transcriptional regulator [Amycolatopsis magusensis]|uniref:AcrR family transcriptional regulator n=1 Tax=Amycolatopsis magusensis TaxID=882444 RepID=A0ABS4PP96_9PSEU|nr:TetR family transcriptional regulator [Amycolatopsis magusensis]MBP2181255.1 AcrR family transcriptional regulator [Amycolatopsis magusensis]MDI5976959.1 TetR/AcrR family transcriptional regulator [Amycolatopsis magusensis]